MSGKSLTLRNGTFVASNELADLFWRRTGSSVRLLKSFAKRRTWQDFRGALSLFVIQGKITSTQKMPDVTLFSLSESFI